MPSRKQHRSEPGKLSRAAFIRAQGDAPVDVIIARGREQNYVIDRDIVGKVRWLQSANAKKKRKRKSSTKKSAARTSKTPSSVLAKFKAPNALGAKSAEDVAADTIAKSINALVLATVKREFRRIMEAGVGKG